MLHHANEIIFRAEIKIILPRIIANSIAAISKQSQHASAVQPNPLEFPVGIQKEQHFPGLERIVTLYKPESAGTLLCLANYAGVPFENARFFSVVEHLQVGIPAKLAGHYADPVSETDFIAAGHDKGKSSYEYLAELQRVGAVNHFNGIAPDVIAGTDFFENLPVVEQNVRCEPGIGEVRAADNSGSPKRRGDNHGITTDKVFNVASLCSILRLNRHSKCKIQQSGKYGDENCLIAEHINKLGLIRVLHSKIRNRNQGKHAVINDLHACPCFTTVP